jgi:SPP1 family predicted phage head-tail adaptor
MSLAQRLNKRVTIQQRTTGEDDFGQPVETWADLASVWAAIEDMSGKQYFVAQAAQNPVQTRITIRHRVGVVPTMRVLHGLDIYDIQAVLGQDGRTLDLMCAKGFTDG